MYVQMPVLQCSVPQEKFCMCVQMPGVYWANTARLRTTGQARFAGKEKQKSKYFDRHINTTHSCQPTVLSHLQPPSLPAVLLLLFSGLHPPSIQSLVPLLFSCLYSISFQAVMFLLFSDLHPCIHAFVLLLFFLLASSQHPSFCAPVVFRLASS
jgi:hypothetical protein